MRCLCLCVFFLNSLTSCLLEEYSRFNWINVDGSWTNLLLFKKLMFFTLFIFLVRSHCAMIRDGDPFTYSMEKQMICLHCVFYFQLGTLCVITCVYMHVTRSPIKPMQSTDSVFFPSFWNLYYTHLKHVQSYVSWLLWARIARLHFSSILRIWEIHSLLTTRTLFTQTVNRFFICGLFLGLTDNPIWCVA